MHLGSILVQLVMVWSRSNRTAEGDVCLLISIRLTHPRGVLIVVFGFRTITKLVYCFVSQLIARHIKECLFR